MGSFDAIGYVVLAVALATTLVVVLMARQQRKGSDGPIWFFSAVVGILLGVAGSVAGARLAGYDLAKRELTGVSEATPGAPAGPPPMGAPAFDAAGNPAPGAAAKGGGKMAGGGMGMPKGGGMGGGMGGGGGRGPSAKRQLTSLVRKLDLLTGDIKINLNAEQVAKLQTQLAKLKSAEEMTDTDAQTEYDSMLAILDEQQKAKQDAIGLPFRAGGGGGGGGFGGGGGGGGFGGGGGGGGGGGASSDSNPFEQEENSQALVSLLAKLNPASASESSATSTNAEKKDDAQPTATPANENKEATAQP